MMLYIDALLFFYYNFPLSFNRKIQMPLFSILLIDLQIQEMEEHLFISDIREHMNTVYGPNPS